MDVNRVKKNFNTNIGQVKLLREELLYPSNRSIIRLRVITPIIAYINDARLEKSSISKYGVNIK
jgi:hypothetical protein